jgi:hypothetical protein
MIQLQLDKAGVGLAFILDGNSILNPAGSPPWLTQLSQFGGYAAGK